MTNAKTPNDQHLDDDFIDHVGTVEVEVESILGLQSFQTTVRHHSTVFQPAQPPPPPQQQQEAQLMLTTGSTCLLAVSRARDGVP